VKRAAGDVCRYLSAGGGCAAEMLTLCWSAGSRGQRWQESGEEERKGAATGAVRELSSCQRQCHKGSWRHGHRGGPCAGGVELVVVVLVSLVA
jgi:hypothetical protein